MTGARAVCVSILIAAAVVPVAVCQTVASRSAVDQQALDAIRNCVRRLDAQTDSGYETVAVRCPDLTGRLQASQWSAWLPGEWNTPGNDLSVQGLNELSTLLIGELRVQAAGPQPDLARLHRILARMGPERIGWPLTLWLRQAFERRPQTSQTAWVDRALLRISLTQALLALSAYVALALVVVLAAGIILNELRVSGLFRRSRSMSPRPAAKHGRLHSRESSRGHVQDASLVDRPCQLLELIAARLAEQGRAPPVRSLTIRELLQAAHLSDRADEDVLAEIALVAERIRFSGQPVDIGSVQGALERGRRLLEQLR